MRRSTLSRDFMISSQPLLTQRADSDAVRDLGLVIRFATAQVYGNFRCSRAAMLVTDQAARANLE
jgi:hypothetical protein